MFISFFNGLIKSKCQFPIFFYPGWHIGRSTNILIFFGIFRRRYLENLGICRNIYSVFGLALCFPPYVLKTIFSSFPETIQFSDLTVLHITKNAAKPEQFSNLVDAADILNFSVLLREK